MKLSNETNDNVPMYLSPKQAIRYEYELVIRGSGLYNAFRVFHRGCDGAYSTCEVEGCQEQGGCAYIDEFPDRTVCFGCGREVVGRAKKFVRAVKAGTLDFILEGEPELGLVVCEEDSTDEGE